MILRPYKGCNPSQITQPFIPVPQGGGRAHLGVDFKGTYGTSLIAPEKCLVYRIIDLATIDLSPENPQLKRGFGIRLESLENANRYFLYWHTLPVFPVAVNDIVEAGQIVAQLGNSGSVRNLGGEDIPLELRNKPPYPGSHLHMEIQINGTAVDPLPYIDFSKEVNPNNILSVIQSILNKIANLLKGR